MRLFYFLILTLLIISCTEKTIEIRTSDAEDIGAGDAYIRTTKIETEQIDEAEEPLLRIISPNDVGLIKNSTVFVRLQAENFKLVPVGKSVKDREGHFHVWLDSIKKVGPETIVAFENVTSGKHTIVAELVKSDHSSLSPRVTRAITVNIESDFVPNETQQQAGIREFAVEAADNYFYPNKIHANIGDKVIIHFKFREDLIYFGGLDIKGPFPDIRYKLKGEQPLSAEFEMKGETKITSWWPASGVKKATLTVEVEK